MDPDDQHQETVHISFKCLSCFVCKKPFDPIKVPFANLPCAGSATKPILVDVVNDYVKHQPPRKGLQIGTCHRQWHSREAASGALPISFFANQLSNRLQVLVASLGLGRLIGELAIEKCEALRLPAHFSPSSSRGVLLFERRAAPKCSKMKKRDCEDWQY